MNPEIIRIRYANGGSIEIIGMKDTNEQGRPIIRGLSGAIHEPYEGFTLTRVPFPTEPPQQAPAAPTETPVSQPAGEPLSEEAPAPVE